MISRRDGAASARARARLKELLMHAGPPPLRAPRRRRRNALARTLIAAVGFFAAVGVIALIGFAFLLAYGPIDLDSLKPSLLAALQERLGDNYRVSLGATQLMQPGKGFSLGLGFSDIEIDDATGRKLVSAPGGRIGLDLLALVGLEVKVKRLELDGLVVNLRLRKDGQFEIAAANAAEAKTIVAAPPPVTPDDADPAKLTAQAIDFLADERQPLDHIAIERGRLQVENEALGKAVVFTDLSASYDRRKGTAEAKLSARGPSGLWSADAKAAFSGERRLTLQANDLAFEDFALLGSKPPAFFSDMPISSRFDAVLAADGTLKSLRGAFSLGAGFFRLDDPDFSPWLIDEATGRLEWDGERKHFAIEALEILAGPSHVRFSGAVSPPATTSDPWAIALSSSDTVLGAERPGGKSVTLNDLELEARAFPREARFVVDRLKIHGPDVDGGLAVDARGQGDDPGLKLNVTLQRSNLASVLRLWPSFLNPEARTWCLDHIHGGEAGSGEIQTHWTTADLDAMHNHKAIPADSVRGEFTFVGAAVDVLDGVPPISGVDATGAMTGRTFEISAKHGDLNLASGRKLQTTNVVFRVPDTSPAQIVPAFAEAHIQGPADALAELISTDALRRYAGIALDPANVKGQAQGQLTLDLKMGRGARPDDQRFHVVGSLAGLQLDKYANGIKFTEGAIDFEADSNGMKAQGQGAVNGVAAKIELAKSPTDEGSLGLAMTLDDALRAKFGLTIGPPMTGPATLKLKAPLGRGSADVEIDLTKTEVNNFDGSVLKSAGKPGKVSLALKSGPDGVAINALAVDAGALVARGTAQFAADGALQNVKLSQLKLAAADDLKLDVVGGQTLKATLTGNELDARSLIKTFLSRDASTSAVKDLDVDAKVATVLGDNGETISQADFQLSRRSGAVRSLRAVAKLGQGALSVRKDDAGSLTVRADDAGALAKFLNFYNHIEDGQLDLTLQDAPDGGRGHAVLTNFTLRNETALRKFANAAPSRSGQRSDQGGGATDAEAVRFDKLTADFVRTSGRIDISDLLIYNPTQGLTLSGAIDFSRDKVDISGVFVPAYQVNNLVTGIPVFGALLAGGEHEGLFGINFRISGAASAPILTINPLSGVTPGIFRKIFGAFDGTNSAPTR